MAQNVANSELTSVKLWIFSKMITKRRIFAEKVKICLGLRPKTPGCQCPYNPSCLTQSRRNYRTIFVQNFRKHCPPTPVKIPAHITVDIKSTCLFVGLFADYPTLGDQRGAH